METREVSTPAELEAEIRRLVNAPGIAAGIVGYERIGANEQMPYPEKKAASGGGKDPNEIGALWEKSGKSGKYYTGEINGERVVVFPVNRKHDRSPAFRVLKSVQGGAPAAAPRKDEDIPF